ncbi:MAG: spermidine/putrescine transporter ATP-binding protein [Haloplasmataceae bacterium]|nr:spermidine/putrescine transporter ATP-binding protein [Haloplasmataceae bacterium]
MKLFKKKEEVNISMDNTVTANNNVYLFSNNKIKNTDNFNRNQAKTLLEIRNLSKEFNGNIVLKGINLEIKENEFMTFLGPSGCGKTTTLRIIAGFDEPTSGDVVFEGSSILNLPPYERPVNTVFQKYALFPHMNVYDNIAFGLKMMKTHNDEIKDKVLHMLKMVKLEGFEHRNVDSLSGGQQQRVAIARALILEPKVLLLDEPLGALDLKLRQEMQYELKEMQRKVGITFIFVTHDQEEALTMSDTIVVMRDGLIQQVGSPIEIYNEPKNRYVANFIGESNIIEGTMIEDYKVKFENEVFDCIDRGFKPNQDIDVVIRPEDLLIIPKDNAKIIGVVESVIFKGVHYEICVIVNGKEYVIHSTDRSKVGDIVGLDVDAEDIHIMEKEMVG